MKTFLLPFFLSAISLASAAPQPDLVSPGKIIAQPTLQAPLSKPWIVAKGIWTPANGIITANQIPAQKHPAVLNLPTGPAPMIVECDFQFNTAKVFVVGCNAKTGHVGRVTISPAKIAIAENSKVNGKVTNHVLAQQVVALKPTDWQHLRVEYTGDKLAAWLNDTSLQAEHPFLATPKAAWFFAATDGVQLRNIRITEGVPGPAAP